MPNDPRKGDPGEDPRKDMPILELFIIGDRMVDDYTEDSAVRDFLEMHPEANEANVRAELTRELEALDEK